MTPTDPLSPNRDAPRVSDRATRFDVVAACRVLHESHLSNTVWGLVAVRDSDGGGIWVTREGVGFSEVGDDDVVAVCLDGTARRGSPEADAETELALAILARRPEVTAVVRCHSLYATAFSVTGRSLHAISHEGCHLVAPDQAAWRREAPGRAGGWALDVAEALTGSQYLLLAGHGLVTVGATLGEAVALANYVEKAARLQLLAGDELHLVSPAEVEAKRLGQLNRPRLSWDYLRRRAFEVSGTAS